MSTPGRKPKPVELKILEGNPGHRPLPNNTPKPPPVSPSIPRGIHPTARRVWRALAPKLEALGLLTEIDGPAFTMLCSHYAMAFEAMALITEQGMQAEDENGAMRKHPMHQVFRDNSASLRQWAAEFGLTPSARTRLSLPEPEDADEFFGY